MVGASSEASGGRAGSEGWSVPDGVLHGRALGDGAWPLGPVMHARNFWASAACLLDFSTPPPLMLTNAPGPVLEVVQLGVLAAVLGLAWSPVPVVVVDQPIGTSPALTAFMAVLLPL